MENKGYIDIEVFILFAGPLSARDSNTIEKYIPYLRPFVLSLWPKDNMVFGPYATIQPNI